MAISVAAVSTWIDKSAGAMRAGLVDITFDDSYVTDGEPLASADILPSNSIYALDPVGGGSLLYEFIWDSTNAKIIVVVRATGAEVANATDLAAVTQRFFYRGV